MTEDVTTNDVDLEVPEGSAYDEIMAQQKMSVEELKEHMTGPVIAILLHAIILPCVIGMVISEPAEQQPDIIVAKEEVVLEPPPPPPPPPDIPPPDNVTPDDKPFDRPVVEDQTEVTTEDVEIPAEVMVDAPINPFVIPPNNSRKVIGSASPFGRKGGGRGGNGGFGNGMSGLQGSFYDLKQDQSQRPSSLSNAHRDVFARDGLKSFVDGGWNQATLKGKYYESQTKLYSSVFYIPNIDANEAPKAYECDTDVKPSRWMAVYSGRVLAPKTGTFRFAGCADDVITVRVNKKVLLDYGWSSATMGKACEARKWRDAMERNQYANKADIAEIEKAGVYTMPANMYKYQATPSWNNHLGGIAVGDSFSVTKGEVLDIDIMISEIPGGRFFAFLGIEDCDLTNEYERDPQYGSPILPLFRTSSALPEVKPGAEIPPFSPNGPIWRTVSKNYDPKKSTESSPVKNDELIKF